MHVNYSNMTVLYNYNKRQNSLMIYCILHECKNTLFYCINNLCKLVKTLIRANAPLKCYCIYRLHKKVDCVCIVQFCMQNCSIYHRLTFDRRDLCSGFDMSLIS